MVEKLLSDQFLAESDVADAALDLTYRDFRNAVAIIDSRGAELSRKIELKLSSRYLTHDNVKVKEIREAAATAIRTAADFVDRRITLETNVGLLRAAATVVARGHQVDGLDAALRAIDVGEMPAGQDALEDAATAAKRLVSNLQDAQVRIVALYARGIAERRFIACGQQLAANAIVRRLRLVEDFLGEAHAETAKARQEDIGGVVVPEIRQAFIERVIEELAKRLGVAAAEIVPYVKLLTLIYDLHKAWRKASSPAVRTEDDQLHDFARSSRELNDYMEQIAQRIDTITGIIQSKAAV